MGYSHYFAYTPQAERFHAVWLELRLDAGAIVRLVENLRLIELADADGYGRPRTGEDEIALNGPAAHGEDYDALSITLSPPGPDGAGYRYGFCKTGPLVPLPYDEAVTAVLLRAHQLAPQCFAIDSDGDWERDWLPARAICTALFDAPGPAACPFTPRVGSTGPTAARIRTAHPTFDRKALP